MGLVSSRLHMLVENEFSVSIRPRVHPPAEGRGAEISGHSAYLSLYMGARRTSMVEYEDWPSTRWSVALWGEDTDGELAEGVVLDLGYWNGVRSTQNGGGGTDGRIPRNVLEVGSVLNVLAVEVSVLLEELGFDLRVDGLENGTLGGHFGQWTL